jgi:hypothetical protein
VLDLISGQKRVFIRPKEIGRPCEDFVLVWGQQGRFALSDGASTSFDSRGWARTLCWQFMRNANVGADWLETARLRYARRAPVVDDDDWSSTYAAERGSFATFLGLTLTDVALKGYAIGDSVVFVVTADEKVVTYPDLTVSNFSEPPKLLCSRPGRSAFDDSEESFSNSEFHVLVPEGGWQGTVLIAATDAVAQWVVGAVDDTERISRLRLISRHRDNASFEAWISEAINLGQIKHDDCSVLIVDL